MTDKQHNTRNDTQKAGGELQGRTHTEDRTGQATEHTAAGAEGKRREGRKGGRREGHGWPRAWGAEEGTGRSTSSRERAGIERGDRGKKEIYKYLRERGEEKHR